MMSFAASSHVLGDPWTAPARPGLGMISSLPLHVLRLCAFNRLWGMALFGKKFTGAIRNFSTLRGSHQRRPSAGWMPAVSGGHGAPFWRPLLVHLIHQVRRESGAGRWVQRSTYELVMFLEIHFFGLWAVPVMPARTRIEQEEI